MLRCEWWWQGMLVRGHRGTLSSPVGANGSSMSCRCSVFLLDRLSHELVAKVFDGGVVDDEVSTGWSWGAWGCVPPLRPCW